MFELKAFKDVFEECQETKRAEFDELLGELREKVLRASSNEEMENMLSEYSIKIENAFRDLDSKKDDNLKEVRRRLKRNRLKKKKDLYKYACVLFSLI